MLTKFVLNGKPVEARLRGGERLMDLLWRLGVRSVKEGCGTGDCGSCNVLVDGKLVNSCMMLAVQVRGRSVFTAEGFDLSKELHPVQKAFLDYAASQCGYCIPGILVTTKYIMEKYPDASEEDIRRILIANICRCGGYTRIVEAVKSVLPTQRRQPPPSGP